MRPRRFAPTLMLIGLVLGSAVACDRPPDADALRVDERLNTAAMEGAATYAPQEFKAAREAQTRLTAELTLQETRWFPTYEKARQLAGEATQAAEKLEQATSDGKEQMRDDTMVTITSVNESLADVRRLLQQSAGRRRPVADPAALTVRLNGIESTLARADKALQDGAFAEAKTHAEAARAEVVKLRGELGPAPAAANKRVG